MRAKILVARKFGPEQTKGKEHGGGGARFFARTRHIALRAHGNAGYFLDHNVRSLLHVRPHSSPVGSRAFTLRPLLFLFFFVFFFLNTPQYLQLQCIT